MDTVLDGAADSSSYFFSGNVTASHGDGYAKTVDFPFPAEHGFTESRSHVTNYESEEHQAVMFDIERVHKRERCALPINLLDTFHIKNTARTQYTGLAMSFLVRGHK